MWDYGLAGVADIRTTAYEDACRLIAQNWPTAVVSIMDDKVPPKFWNQLVISTTVFYKQRQLLSQDSMLALGNLVRFSRKLGQQDKLLIHCPDGLQLCPSAMMAVLLAKTDCCAMTAHNLVRRQCSRMRPEQRVIEVIDDFFNLRRRLVDHNQAWLDGQIK